MTCRVSPDDMSKIYYDMGVRISHTDTKWGSVQIKIDKFFKTHRLQFFNLLVQHVILRSKLKPFPVLTQKSNSMQGNFDSMHWTLTLSSLFLASHLCDTRGCVADKHLLAESTSVNGSRSRCQGIILLLRPGTPMCILDWKPCRDGLTYSDVKSIQLQYSCRKIRVHVLSASALAYFVSKP